MFRELNFDSGVMLLYLFTYRAITKSLSYYDTKQETARQRAIDVGGSFLCWLDSQAGISEPVNKTQ